MIILIRDSLRQFVLALQRIRHRLVVRVRFINTSSLQEQRIHAYPVDPEDMPLAAEFFARSNIYRSRPVVKFSREEAGIYRFGHGISIHEARFIRFQEDTLIDVGQQSRDPLSILRKPFAKKPTEERKRLLMPWDGGGASYGDFIIKVLPKLSRLLDAMPADARGDYDICLSHFHQCTWAVEYLALMGIEKARILDGNTTILVPEGGELILGTGPQLGHGIAHPSDIRAMMRRLNSSVPSPPVNPWRKIYISRKTGRKMLNEDELIRGLRERNFEIIHLEELSLGGQIKLFQEAAVIAGPHGAGHANIIWSSPGAQLLEVFHPSWMHPSYAILSGILGIGYHCLVGHKDDKKGSWTEKSRYGIFEDPSIDPEVFFRKLDTLSKQ